MDGKVNTDTHVHRCPTIYNVTDDGGNFIAVQIGDIPHSVYLYDPEAVLQKLAEVLGYVVVRQADIDQAATEKLLALADECDNRGDCRPINTSDDLL